MQQTANPRHPVSRSGLLPVATRIVSIRSLSERGGFSLIELLVVLAIIGLIAAVSLPALKSSRRNNAMVAAGRQLVDDLALARAKAIAERTTVHVVFVPPTISGMNFAPGATAEAVRDQKLGKRLKGAPYTTYALFAERSVGDQPGRSRRRYMSDWRTLPEGVFIAPWEFDDVPANTWDTMATTNRPFRFDNDFTFPSIAGLAQRLPHVSFDAKGSLLMFDSQDRRVYWDESISLARGSIMFSRDPGNDEVIEFDVRESPKDNSIENFHRVVIDGLTGRARVETPQIQ